LLIDVGYAVKTPASCQVTAELWAGDLPLHAATWQGEVAPLAGAVPLRFFGKVFHDRGYESGPLTVRNLAARCEPSGGAGGPVTWEDTPAPARPFTTIEHHRREFSPEGWDGR
jgi:hypothetical protein